MAITVTVAPPPPRNAFALHAASRRAVAFRHKAAGRGGVRNESRDLLEAALEETEQPNPYQATEDDK